MTNIEQFLEQAEKEAMQLPKIDREAQIERIRAMWESYRGEDRIVTSQELASAMEGEEHQKKIITGFESVDKLTGGFTYEQLVIVSAQEKTGKTSWVLQIVDNMKEENPCCFLFEQSPREIIRQMRDRGQEIPYFVTPLVNTDNSYEWIEKRSLEAMVKKGSRVFVIDNVDWVQKEQGYNERSDEAIKNLLLKLKGFCTRWGVIIILVAHVKKVKMEQIPQPDDIKDTSAFKQIADTVIILWRKVEEVKVQGTKTKAGNRTNQTLVWVAENRRTGKTGYAQMIFDGKKFIPQVWDIAVESKENVRALDERDEIPFV